MGLKLARVRTGKQIGWAFVDGRRLLRLSNRPLSTAEALEAAAPYAQGKNVARLPGSPIEKSELLSPITQPCRIICQGKNYLEHIRETGFRPQDKTFNLLFQKADSSLNGPRSAVVRPHGVRLLDYEIELGLVIGTPLNRPRSISADDLFDYVAGMIIANDLSARDVQVPQGQWFKGKSYRGFCPTGPWIFLPTRRERSRWSELELKLRVNGELRQSSLAANMIYPPHETLSELSRIVDLAPGDLVLTGTPSGVAMQVGKAWQRRILGLFYSEAQLMRLFVRKQAESPRYLKDGDVIHASIASSDGALDLGMQETTIVSELR
ncbi:MAG: fumarylacetoacetate hydrolase family protein [Leptospirales bacterium]|nr:fumarylacetoacetate hydrolase family protein [Leptospirales bacterium]